MKRCITEKQIYAYQQFLYEEEKSSATIEKYIRDLRKLQAYMDGQEVTKVRMIEYKEALKQSHAYQLSSINSFIVAANRFCEFMGWYDLKIKIFRMQKEAFMPENQNLSRVEYKRLVQTAEKQGKKRLALLIETICATGIRVSELKGITVKSVEKGVADIYCKGKARKILIPQTLQKKLLCYIKKQNIIQGIVFQTASGNALDRSNIWREMKALCEAAGVLKDKVYPHNLRHLFARVFYHIGKDIAKLADVMGHSNIETTRNYIKTSGFEHKRQLDAMGLVCAVNGDTT